MSLKQYIKKILEKRSQVLIIFGERQWKDKITYLNFNKIRKNTYTLYSKPYTKDLLFKFLHYATKTYNYIYKIRRDKKGITPLCDYCHKFEDNIHLYTTCNRIKKMDTLPTNIQKTNKATKWQQHIFTLRKKNLNTKNKKLTLTVTQIIMSEIWTSRDNLKYDKVQMTQEIIITKIITHLQNIITAHYKLHKLNDTLTLF